MIKVEVNMPEVVSRCKELIAKPGEVIRYIKQDLRRDLRSRVERLMESEITVLLGRRRYQRKTVAQPNRRNGHRRRRYTLRWLGEMVIRVPRDRLGKYQTELLPRYKRYDDELGEEASVLFLLGMSTRNISMISKQLFGRKLSASEISENNKALNLAIEPASGGEDTEFKPGGYQVPVHGRRRL